MNSTDYFILPGPAKSFQDRFCEYYHCSHQAFPSEALIRLIHHRGMRLASVLWRIRPQLFRADLEILRKIGAERSRKSARWERSRIEMEYRSRNQLGLLRSGLNVRICEERLLQLVDQVWPGEKSELQCPGSLRKPPTLRADFRGRHCRARTFQDPRFRN